MHGKGVEQHSKNKIKRILYKYAFKRANTICLSQSLTKDIKGVVNGNIYTVNNGIPDRFPLEPAAMEHSEKNKFGILFLSNLLKDKGIYDFLLALQLLKKNNLDFYCDIVGAEGDVSKEDILDCLKKLNLSNRVTYHGEQYGQSKYQYFDNADCFVLPSKNEAFPLVILEAMQHHLPVISTKEGAIPEIIDNGITGFLIDKESPDQIAEKIEILINNPVLRIRMGNEARHKYERHFSLQQFEKNLQRVFSDNYS